MKGYLWDYKIDTRILNKEYLSINAKNKNITNTSETKDAILMQLELSSQMQRYIKINFKRRFPVQAFAWTLI